MVMAVYPGTFDPVTLGHIDIAARAAKLFDHVIVAVYDRPMKNLLFSTEERVQLTREALKGFDNVSVESYSGLTVTFAEQKRAQVLVRGLRVMSDFELEFQMAITNRKLSSIVDTVCLMTSQEYAFLSSSVAKEIAMVDGCLDQMVPPHVAKALHERFQRLGKAAGDKVRIVSLKE